MSTLAPTSSTSVGPVVVGKHRPHRGPINSRQRSQLEHGSGHHGARGSSGYERVGDARTNQLKTDDDRAVSLAPDGERRRLLHLDRFGGRDDLDPRSGGEWEYGLYPARLAHERDADPLGELGERGEGSRHRHLGCPVSSHRVDRDGETGAGAGSCRHRGGVIASRGSP